jgi:hypothetical protein
MLPRADVWPSDGARSSERRLAGRGTFIKAIERTRRDMRHLRTAVGLVATTCLLAVFAAPALGHEFVAFKFNHTASELEPFKTNQKMPEGQEQTFIFGSKQIKCKVALGKGILTSNTTLTVGTKITFSKCGYHPLPKEPEFIPATVKGGLTVNFKVDGAGEFLGNGEGEELEYGVKAELLETATTVVIGAGKFCTFIIPTQTIPARAKLKPEEEFSTIKYSNVGVPKENTPTNMKLYPGLPGEPVQQKVLFTYNLKPFKYKFKEETQCFADHEEGGKPTEFAAGSWEGELLTEVISGNLTFK